MRDLKGPWLLYDNQQDPYQLTNLANEPKLARTQKQLEGILAQKLRAANDNFQAGNMYMDKWNYPWSYIDSLDNPYHK